MMSAEIVICDNLDGLTTQGHKSVMHLSFHSQPEMLVSINYQKFILGDGDNAIAYDKILRSYNAGIDGKCNSMS